MAVDAVDFGASGRTDTYSLELVDPRTLNVVSTGLVDPAHTSLTWKWDTENVQSANVTLAEGTDYRVGGMDCLVRIKQRVRIPSEGYDRSFDLATMWVQNVSTSSLNGRVTRDLPCYSPLWRYTQDILHQDFYRSVGDNVVEDIRLLAEGVGGHLVVGDGVDTTRRHTIDVWLNINKNRGEAMRLVASWIGCVVLPGTDGSTRLEANRLPSERPVAYEFVEGPACTFVPGIEWDTNRDEPYNRVVVSYSRKSKQDGDPYPLTDTAIVDLDDGAEFSFVRCGRYRTQSLELTDPCSHDDLVAQGRAYLASGPAASLDITFEGVGIPGLEVGDVVRYRNETDHGRPVDYRAQVTEISTRRLVPRMACTYKLRVIGGY